MKSNSKIALWTLGMVGVAIAAWLMMRSTEPNAKVPEKPITQKPQTPMALPPPKVYATTIIQPLAHTKYLRLEDPRWKIYNEQTALDPNYEWNTPIEFYGKVVDENNQPVPNALAEIEWNGTSARYGGDGVVHKTIYSDANGLITIQGIFGKGLSVRVKKDGYHSLHPPNGGNFEYGGFWEPEFIEPDRNNPVVFKLIKRPIAELTYSIFGSVLVPPPLLQAHLDLLKLPTLSDTPVDLDVRIIRPTDLKKNHKDETWALEIEGLAGTEIVLSDEEFLLKAPFEGYQSKIIRNYQGVTPQKLSCYVRNPQRGYYAAIKFEIMPWRWHMNMNYGVVDIHGVVNPNNSPNLEYDKTKNIRMIEEENNRRRRR